MLKYCHAVSVPASVSPHLSRQYQSKWAWHDGAVKQLPNQIGSQQPPKPTLHLQTQPKQLPIPQQTLVKPCLHLIWSSGRALQGEEALSKCLPQQSVWSREQGERMAYTTLWAAAPSLLPERVLTVPKAKSARGLTAFPLQCLHWIIDSPGTRKLSSIWAPREPTGEQAFGEFPFLLQASISPRKSWTTLPESLYFPSCTAPTHCKQKIGQNREKRDPTAPTRQRESCFLKPGRSSGICSFISSRRGASVFPPVSLKHNSWISVSGADSLLLFKMHSHHN